ncbi:MAG: beta-glucosidase, partial [Lentisphaerae bacterium]
MSRCPKTCCYVLVLVGLVTGIISGAEGGKADQEAINRRVEALLKKMTLEEKFGQLLCYDGRTVSQALKSGDYLFGSIARGGVFRGKNAEEAAKKYNEIQKTVISKSRLGIPFIYHEEALHGLLLNQGTTYPQAIGLAASWNPQLVSRVAAAIAEEARARGVRQVLAPVINIARDVRWGRVEETFGEDPYLTSRLAVAYCREFESRGIVSTPKHFVANVGDGGRDSHIVHFSERILREIYFPAFRACVQEAGARSIMAAYNALDGIPCNAHPWLLTDVLRKEWGFRGFVVSDYVAVPWMIQKHRTAATKEEATAQAVIAGLEVECPRPTCFKEGLPKAVKSGLLPMPVLDEAVRRVLRVKFEIGLFDQPYADPARAKALADCAEFRALAREACRQSIVLLK